jgi:hypothetical protein
MRKETRERSKKRRRRKRKRRRRRKKRRRRSWKKIRKIRSPVAQLQLKLKPLRLALLGKLKTDSSDRMAWLNSHLKAHLKEPKNHTDMVKLT